MNFYPIENSVRKIKIPLLLVGYVKLYLKYKHPHLEKGEGFLL